MSVARITFGREAFRLAFGLDPLGPGEFEIAYRDRPLPWQPQDRPQNTATRVSVEGGLVLWEEA